MAIINILDGAMGSLFIKRGISLPKHIWSAQLNLEAREVVYKIHREYIDAGADYITTNTFRTTPRAYMKLGLSQNESEIIARASLNSAVVIAKDAAKKQVKILGSIAPLEDCYTPELFPGKEDAKAEFKQLGEWLYDAKIDIFLIETMNSITEAETCIKAIKEYKLPIWISFVLRDDKHILSGESLRDAISMASEHEIQCFLLNCNPIKRTEKALEIVSKKWNKEWGIYPNLGVGEPDPDGIIDIIYSDKDFIDLINNAISKGARVVGGCCGSEPKHIKLINNFNFNNEE